jgi:hypothetical protein
MLSTTSTLGSFTPKKKWKLALCIKKN